MRNTLVILNYQREIPPYLQNLIHYADAAFERILYLTPELHNDNRAACRAERLRVIECPRAYWRRALLKSPAFLLSGPVRAQFALARRNGMRLSRVGKQIVRHSVCGNTLFQGFRALVKRGEICPAETVVLSSWFSSEAYAAARIKRAFPDAAILSFAHSFEVNRDQNPYVMYDMNRVKHSGADFVIFIAERMRSIYREELARLYPDLTDESWRTHYLGSTKRFSDRVCSPSADGVLRLVSCSSAVEVKRIHLIIEALAQWQGSVPVHWTHIGGGPLLESLKQQAAAALDGKSGVRYTFTGPFTNEQVQQFYVDQPVDLFVNVSRIEGLPVSLMECMSYGIPALATDVGGSREIVNERTGFLLPKAFDAPALLAVLESYIALDPARKGSLRRDCLAMWEEKFNARTNSGRLFDWLKSL